MPIFLASASITGSIFVSTARVSASSSTPWHFGSLHMPLLAVSYFEPFIAALAFATEPWSPGVLYGLKPWSLKLNRVSGTMWFATAPIVGPLHPWTSAALSMIQFIARRTWTSSKGGWVRFIVMYQVRSPEFWKKCDLRLELVAYFRSTWGGMLEVARSSWPASILL